MLDSMAAAARDEMLGGLLYPLVAGLQPECACGSTDRALCYFLTCFASGFADAGKVTGMLLELTNADLLDTEILGSWDQGS